MGDTLVVNEIFLSVQGESTLAGFPCIFIRLTACNLRCSYCDTAYAFNEGRKMTLAEIQQQVHHLATKFDQRPAPFRLPLVELTGGEPLLQPLALPLMLQLCNAGWTVMLETSGAHDIGAVDHRVRRIMDLKCPSSGEVDQNRWENIPCLRSTDEVKFVLGTREDYDWARQTLEKYRLYTICPVLFSWVMPLTVNQQHPSLNPVPTPHTPITQRELAEKILTDALPVRLQFQLHKLIWPPDARGV